MRLVLENSRHAEVPLNDDLEALRGYLDLERNAHGKEVRFRSRWTKLSIRRGHMFPTGGATLRGKRDLAWYGGEEGKGHITLSVARRVAKWYGPLRMMALVGMRKKEASPLGQLMKKTSLEPP
ncbi:MAG: hypothetical protein IPI00_00730 [Flavobacteriales bacterium]|nr:hypothetical protein [Flavobacteriales bacterium]